MIQGTIDIKHSNGTATANKGAPKLHLKLLAALSQSEEDS